MSPFIQIFMQGGILMFPLLLISLVLLGIVIRATWHLLGNGGADTAAVENCLDGLLFWGSFAVIIGVLGSAIGYHRAMSAITAYGVVNPRAVWIGSAEGMVSTIAGLLVLAGAGTSWFVLRWRYLRYRQGVN